MKNQIPEISVREEIFTISTCVDSKNEVSRKLDSGQNYGIRMSGNVMDREVSYFQILSFAISIGNIVASHFRLEDFSLV